MTNDALGEEKQRDYIIQKTDILSFQGPTAFFAVQQGVLVPCDRLTFHNQGLVPERPINVNPGLKFCSVFVFYIPLRCLG